MELCQLIVITISQYFHQYYDIKVPYQFCGGAYAEEVSELDHPQAYTNDI